MGWLSNLGRGALAFGTGGLSELVPLAMGSDLGESLPFVGAGETNRRNRAFAKEQFKHQQQVDSRNFANVDRAFNEQAFLNRNGLQIQASDAQKAGINPLAMSSGSLSSLSAQPVSTSHVNGNQSVVDNANSLLSLLDLAHQSKMQKTQIQADKQMHDDKLQNDFDIARIQADSNERINQSKIAANMEMHEADISESRRQFRDNLKHAIDVFNFEKSDKDRNFELNRIGQDIKNDLIDIQVNQSDQAFREACYDFAKKLVTGVGDNPSKLEAIASNLGFNFTRITRGGKDIATEIANSLISNIEQTKRNRRRSK